MEYGLENIAQWVSELAKKPKVTQFHTYARVMRDKERQEKESEIIKTACHENMHGNKEVFTINDDMAIVAFTPINGKTSYIPVVKGKVPVYWISTFEGAIVAALSLLKTDGIEAAKYAGKLLNVKL